MSQTIIKDFPTCQNSTYLKWLNLLSSLKIHTVPRDHASNSLEWLALISSCKFETADQVESYCQLCNIRNQKSRLSFTNHWCLYCGRDYNSVYRVMSFRESDTVDLEQWSAENSFVKPSNMTYWDDVGKWT